MKLTTRVLNFIDGVIEGKTDADAYRDNYNCSRMLPTTVHRLAHALRHDPDVSAELTRRRELLTANSIKSAADVTNEFLRVAFADPGRIVQHRRLNCRYCYGVHHTYQWKDQNEFAEAMRQWEEGEAQRLAARGPKKRSRAKPSDEGGYGFAFNRPPNAACPHCMGEGNPDLFIADTTQLSPEDRRLIKRIKVTKDGIDIQMRDQSDALTKAGQMLGGFKQTVVLQNPDGSPINNAPNVIAMSADDAVAAYKKWMDEGAKKE